MTKERNSRHGQGHVNVYPNVHGGSSGGAALIMVIVNAGKISVGDELDDTFTKEVQSLPPQIVLSRYVREERAS